MPFRFWTWGRKTPTPPAGHAARSYPPPSGRFGRKPSGPRAAPSASPRYPAYDFGSTTAAPQPNRPGMARWVPKYADRADTSSQGKDIPLGGAGLQDPGWFSAPAGSHVHSFSFLDPRYDEYWQTHGGGTSPGRATLMVRFRPSPPPKRPRLGHAPYNVVTEYWYHFFDPAAGLNVFHDMQGADHPGELVWSQLIRGHAPYERKF